MALKVQDKLARRRETGDLYLQRKRSWHSKQPGSAPLAVSSCPEELGSPQGANELQNTTGGSLTNECFQND